MSWRRGGVPAGDGTGPIAGERTGLGRRNELERWLERERVGVVAPASSPMAGSWGFWPDGLYRPIDSAQRRIA
jgi:hypothetical protein